MAAVARLLAAHTRVTLFSTARAKTTSERRTQKCANALTLPGTLSPGLHFIWAAFFPRLHNKLRPAPCYYPIGWYL